MDGQEQKLFSNIYRDYVDKIYRFIYYKTHHKETAEDLTSQTFFKVVESMKKFDSNKGNFSAWLYSIAKNTVIDHYRTKRSEIDISDIWDLAGKDDVERDTEFRENLGKIEIYLKAFSSEQRDIILLRVWDNLSYKEISEIVGKSEANCKMIFSRAINQIRKEEIFALLVLLALTIKI